MRIALPILLAAAAAMPAHSEGWVDAAARPAYRTAETVVDGVYGLVRGHLFSPLLPGRLSRRMDSAPAGTSYALFSEELRRKQDRALRRVAEARPGAPTSSPAELAAWRDRALHEETAALADAFADAMIGRYQLRRFGRDSGGYASDIRNWDREFVTSAVLFGGAYVYAAGLRASCEAGPARVELDLKPGLALRGALESGRGERLASLRLSPRGYGLSLKTEWGLRGGRALAETVGLNYSRRF